GENAGPAPDKNQKPALPPRHDLTTRNRARTGCRKDRARIALAGGSTIDRPNGGGRAGGRCARNSLPARTSGRICETSYHRQSRLRPVGLKLYVAASLREAPIGAHSSASMRIPTLRTAKYV